MITIYNLKTWIESLNTSTVVSVEVNGHGYLIEGFDVIPNPGLGCPVLMLKTNTKEVNKIEIIISGGAVQSVSKPSGITLEIKDYDIDKADAEENESCKKDKDGNWYQSMFWSEDITVQ